NPKRRMTFLSVVAWLSICLLVTGLFPSRHSQYGNIWVLAGLFGLAAAVGLSESAKSEARTQKLLLDTYISEARTDPLLGLANRRAFDIELERLTDDCRKQNQKLSVLLIDLDHFNHFNSEHGYHTGDDMLRAVARMLRTKTRGVGIASRVGGDQLAVILAGMNLQQATQLAQRIHRSIGHHELSTPGGTLSLSSSVAVVEALAEESAAAIFQRLRECLYFAKENGRDHVFWHDGLTARPVGSEDELESEPLVGATPVA
ncbi:MAG: GGDEF domain-containing protein, partial [Planctomycetota bacterium]|nr:GGDEF domain-containing protein [Planctomycetota bacterium]